MVFFSWTSVIGTVAALASAVVICPFSDAAALAAVIGGGLLVMAAIQPQELLLGQVRAVASLILRRTPSQTESDQSLLTIAEVRAEAGLDAALCHTRPDTSLHHALLAMHTSTDEKAIMRAMARRATTKARIHHQYHVALAEWIWLLPSLGAIASMVRAAGVFLSGSALFADWATAFAPLAIGIVLSQGLTAPLVFLLRHRSRNELAHDQYIANAICQMARGNEIAVAGPACQPRQPEFTPQARGIGAVQTA